MKMTAIREASMNRDTNKQILMRQAMERKSTCLPLLRGPTKNHHQALYLIDFWVPVSIRFTGAAHFYPLRWANVNLHFHKVSPT